MVLFLVKPTDSFIPFSTAIDFFTVVFNIRITEIRYDLSVSAAMQSLLLLSIILSFLIS